MTKDYSKQRPLFTYGNILAGSIAILVNAQIAYDYGAAMALAMTVLLGIGIWIGYRTGYRRGDYDGYWERHRQQEEAIAKYDSHAPGHNEGVSVSGMGNVVNAATKRTDHAISIWGGDVKPDGQYVEDGPPTLRRRNKRRNRNRKPKQP